MAVRRWLGAFVFAALCCAIRGAAAAEITPGVAIDPAGISASAHDGGRYPLYAFDANENTYWQAGPVSPATPQWIQYDFGKGNAKTVVAYKIGDCNAGGDCPPPVAAATAPLAFQLQGSNDAGVTWVTVSDVTKQDPLSMTPWNPGELRTFYVKQDADPAKRVAYTRYRLFITQVSGCTGAPCTGSPKDAPAVVRIRALSLILSDSTPSVCAVGARTNLAIDIKLAGYPPPAQANAPNLQPNYQLYVMPTLTNTGKTDLALDGLRIPILWNYGYRDFDGIDHYGPPSNFNFNCWSGSITGPSPDAANACEAYVSMVLGPRGPEIHFSGGFLCPGCVFSGGGQSKVLFVVQNLNYTTLLVDDAKPGRAECGNEQLDMPPPAPAPFFPSADNQHPECQPAPACPPDADLAALQVKMEFVPVSPLDANGVRLNNREIQVKPVITNTGKHSIALAGIHFPIKYNHEVLVPSFNTWVSAGPDEYQSACWYGQINLPKGYRPQFDINACEYLTVSGTPDGFELLFLGGGLCPGCSFTGPLQLANGTDPTLQGVSFVVKHTSYLEMRAAPADFAVLPPTCTPLPPSAKPASCANPAATGAAPATGPAAVAPAVAPGPLPATPVGPQLPVPGGVATGGPGPAITPPDVTATPGATAPGTTAPEATTTPGSVPPGTVAPVTPEPGPAQPAPTTIATPTPMPMPVATEPAPVVPGAVAPAEKPAETPKPEEPKPAETKPVEPKPPVEVPPKQGAPEVPPPKDKADDSSDGDDGSDDDSTDDGSADDKSAKDDKASKGDNGGSPSRT